MRGAYGLMALVLASCGSAPSEPGYRQETSKSTADEGWGGDMEAEEYDAMKPAASPSVVMAGPPARSGARMEPEPSPEPEKSEAKPDDDGGGGDEDVRRWFPEAFLWQPLVETDASGTATVEVRVPDTLTTWRVLALAHTRGGEQAGTIATFDSRLPLYVEPVVPGWMYAGDRVDLPVMVVNTTGSSVTAALDIRASGALSGQSGAAITLAAGDSDVRRVPIAATGVGASTVRASLGDSDAAEREIPVLPVGRPLENGYGGLLAGPRTLRIAGPAGADPVSQELAVLVFPGPLAVVQAEVGRAAAGGVDPGDAAYGYALAADLEDLAARTGAELDAKALRRLRILSWQRVVPHGRAPDAGTAADLLAAMRKVEGQESAQTLETRMIRVVVEGQRADGTWARQSTAPLQQVIVQTAFAARTLPEDEVGARLKAAGALERFAREIKDPYTAAVVLASGLAELDLQVDLVKLLVDQAVEGPDGTRRFPIEGEVQNPWGRRPTESEVLAWTALALATTDVPWKGDLVSQLMGNYDGARGFGAGPADVIALEAVTKLLPGLDQPVTVAMTLDGQEVARQTLDPSQPKQPAVLLGKPGAKNPEIGLTVEPAVPGLVFVASLASWVPWTGEESLGGVEVEVEAEPFQVGRDSTIVLRLSAPSGVALTVEQGLPAGASVDDDALSAVDGVVDSRATTDRVTIRTRTFRAGEVIEVPIVVRPAFAGRFSTGPLVVDSGYERASLPPLTWSVLGEGAVARGQ